MKYHICLEKQVDNSLLKAQRVSEMMSFSQNLFHRIDSHRSLVHFVFPPVSTSEWVRIGGDAICCFFEIII
jgi:hypothetical protein